MFSKKSHFWSSKKLKKNSQKLQTWKTLSWVRWNRRPCSSCILWKKFSLENRFLVSQPRRGPVLTPKREKNVSRKGKNIKIIAAFFCIIFLAKNPKKLNGKILENFSRISNAKRGFSEHDYVKRDEKGVNSWGEKTSWKSMSRSQNFPLRFFHIKKGPFCT